MSSSTALIAFANKKEEIITKLKLFSLEVFYGTFCHVHKHTPVVANSLFPSHSLDILWCERENRADKSTTNGIKKLQFTRLDATIIYMVEQLNPNMNVVCVSRNLIIFHFMCTFCREKEFKTSRCLKCRQFM